MMVGFKNPHQELYHKACQALERGDAERKTQIAFYKLSGRGGIEVDVEGAVSYLKERADAYDDQAMWMLGVCYEYGIGVEKDVDMAERLYNDSRYKGNGIGMFLAENKKRERGSKEIEVESLLHLNITMIQFKRGLMFCTQSRSLM